MSFLWFSAAAMSAAALYTNPIPQPGEEGYRPQPKHHFRIVAENDSGFGRDGNYTSGVRIDYTRDLANGNAWGLSLTQNIYTPETHTYGNVPGQQSYAGIMALGAGYLFRGENMGCSTELQLGCTGNPSLARYTQNGLHDAFGMDSWDGWAAQVPAEAVVQLTSRQDFRLRFLECHTPGGWQTDALFYTREDVGTAMISAGAGLTFRIGRNLPPTGELLGNQRAGFALSTIRRPEYRPDTLSYFFVASFYTAYVARDFSIDGGVVHHFNQTCSRVPWQTETRVGLGASYKGIDYFLGALFYSDRYRTQDWQGRVGTFSITWNW
ncbi:MAG: lipid A deacylase LpxR family protein [Akkermansia sp.]|nr:lipid A deacylase LpxR family protein [Akkermansia sp.]